MKNIILPLILLVTLFSCSKGNEDQVKVDDAIIKQYITDHALTAKPTGSGLYYVVHSPGSGARPTENSTVTVAYKGYFTDGVVFDESVTAGLSFSLNSVIEGWQEGIPLFNEGGSGILLVPSALGYGDKDRGDIPANSVLIFDILLIDVK